MSARDGAKAGLSGVGWFLVGVIALAAIVGAVLGIRWFFAPANGAVEQREQTIGSGAYRISAYDRFYDDCQAALTTQQNLASAKVQLQAAKNEGADPGRLQQLDANVTALQMQLNGQVNGYNADAAKTDTRGHFRSSDLPYSLDATQEIKCHA
jgi:hypothetical protein